MIVSHKHKFIFVKTKKTGGTSLEIALSKICGPDDIITEINPEDEILRKQAGGRGAQNNRIPTGKYGLKDYGRLLLKGQAKTFYNHMSASDIRQYLPSDIWNDYYKFAFERHPHSKVYSHYWWRGGDSHYGSFENYISQKDYRKIQAISFYTSEEEDLLVDAIFKLEDAEDSLTLLSERFDLNEDEKLTIKNIRSKANAKGQRISKQVFLTETRKKKIDELFSDEIDRLYS